MAENIEFAEVPVRASVHTPRATPDEIVAIGVAIWADVKKSGIAASDDAGNDALLDQMREKYKDFATSFPLVMRWIVQARQFSPRALERYLLRHSAAKLETRADFMELQAEYLVCMFCENNPRAQTNVIRDFRSNTVNRLIKEDKEFTEIQKKVEAELAEKNAAVTNDRREKLYARLLSKKVAEAAAAGTPASAGSSAPASTDS